MGSREEFPGGVGERNGERDGGPPLPRVEGPNVVPTDGLVEVPFLSLPPVCPFSLPDSGITFLPRVLEVTGLNPTSTRKRNSRIRGGVVIHRWTSEGW